VLFDEAVRRLQSAFTRELPGATAHAQLAPIPRRQWPAGFDPDDIRHAAALLLVFPRAPHNATAVADAHILLTVRADTLGRHSGQVSLPGGVVDAGETFEQAALREAHEEVGLTPDRVRVLGALTPLDIPVSGFRLHPIVGASDSAPELTPADGEVARILEIDIEALRAPDSIVHTARERDGVTLTTPGFHVQDVEIWGATAMVIAEFLSLLAGRHA